MTSVVSRTFLSGMAVLLICSGGDVGAERLAAGQFFGIRALSIRCRRPLVLRRRSAMKNPTISKMRSTVFSSTSTYNAGPTSTPCFALPIFLFAFDVFLHIRVSEATRVRVGHPRCSNYAARPTNFGAKIQSHERVCQGCSDAVAASSVNRDKGQQADLGSFGVLPFNTCSVSEHLRMESWTPPHSILP